MKEIPLTRGYVALIDDEDYEEISQHKWYASSPKRGEIYAVRNMYRSESQNGGRVYMHAFINKTPKGLETDHINGIGLDNRRSNLRAATNAQNQYNRRPQGGSSKFKGVYWFKKGKKWCARIKVNRKFIYLGFYEDELDAHKAYCEKAKEVAQEFYKEINYDD